MALPDFKKYYYATLITSIIDWHCHSENKDWIYIENASSSLPLRFLPWIQKYLYPMSIKRHPFIGTTLQIFHLTAHIHDIATIPGPLTRIADNPEFSPGLHCKVFPTTLVGSPLLISHCMQAGTIKSRGNLQTSCKDQILPQWTYLQLCSFLNTHKSKHLFSKTPTQLETICLNATMTKKTTSLAYSWLQVHVSEHKVGKSIRKMLHKFPMGKSMYPSSQIFN